MFHRVFIANRGEVAARVARTCVRLGITPVFGVSEADADAPYCRDHERVVLGPGRAAESYLDIERVIQAAVQSQCSALHPGWGFLSENAVFARMCEAYGITFLGPAAHVMALMGQKNPAKKAMREAGLTLIPGSDGVLESAEAALETAKRIGFPVLVKAENGGGGRGMRIARSEDEVERAYNESKAESMACFADDRVYMEKLIERGRHVEIQLLGDKYGNAVHLGIRDCTVQRNHQKLIEESPAPTLSAEERERTLDAAVRAVGAIGYAGAGTMEFLLGDDGVMRFMEMNTRLQVEHCVSEERTGIDLVEQQLRVGAGQALSITQEDIKLDGHAIECRINAEDPSDNFRPAPGVLEVWKAPSGEGIRVDTHVEQGYEVPPHYDSLICKVIASGDTREQAIERMIKALGEMQCEGVPTTAGMHIEILKSADFKSSNYNTSAIPGWPAKEGGQA